MNEPEHTGAIPFIIIKEFEIVLVTNLRLNETDMEYAMYCI